jgi:hypothetical protein
MKTTITAATLGATLIALSFASAANASDCRHARRAVQSSALMGTADPRGAFDYYLDPREARAAAYGIQPGLVYGGTTSAPAGR